MRYLEKINENRAAPGWERTIWRLLPQAFAISLLAPFSVAILARLLIDAGPAASRTIGMVDIAAIAIAITAVTALFTVAIGCIIVYIMKGPGYVADAYELNERNAPAPDAEPAPPTGSGEREIT